MVHGKVDGYGSSETAPFGLLLGSGSYTDGMEDGYTRSCPQDGGGFDFGFPGAPPRLILFPSTIDRRCFWTIASRLVGAGAGWLWSGEQRDRLPWFPACWHILFV
jgi:hypothetical protein